jgi:transmembrane sensor
VPDKLAERLAEASRHIDADFDADDVRHGLAGLTRRIAQRRRLKQGAAAALALGALAVGSISWLRMHEPLAGASLKTHDGSVATKLDAETALVVERDLPHEVALELERGRGRFEVTPDRKRRYRVRAGQVEVEVLGTAFEVERLAASTRVRVEHGVVRVAWRGGTSTLRAGEQGLFPPRSQSDPQTHAASSAASTAVPEALAPEANGPTPQLALDEVREQPALARQRWRALARAGKHREAFGSLGRKPVEDLPGLLLAADAARLSGHPREAARYLERLVQRYPESAPARLAAFTLGRLALYELKQPSLAARSFARAYALDPSGPLAEDALAREAEAYHRAGDAERAQNAAQRYLQRFPNGARGSEMASHVGDAPAQPAAPVAR